MAAEACAKIPTPDGVAGATGLIDLSVVIVSWNTRRVIGACLDSVFKHLGVARWLLAKVLFTTSMVARAAWWRLMAAVGLGTGPRRKARLSAAAARYHLTGREPAW